MIWGRVWKRGEKKIKPWKLEDAIKRRMFEEGMSDRIEGANVDRAGLLNALLNSAILRSLERQQGGDER